MLFKRDHLSKEYGQVHPKVHDLAEDLEVWLKEKAWPEILITHVFRTDDQSEDFYWQNVMDTLKCTEEIARQTARKKASWHKWYCAIDISSKRYDRTQVKEIVEFLKQGRPAPLWEIYLHDVGQGPHFHVGYEDFSWRRKWSNRLTA